MSDMTDFANDYQCETMNEYWDYWSGNVSIPYGEQMPQYVEDFQIPSTQEELTRTLHRADTLGIEQMYPTSIADRDNSCGRTDRTGNQDAFLINVGQDKQVLLNAKAVANLSKENPTCNVCEQEMDSRKGRYGKFYFCPKQCEGQGTVSDDYWQKAKKANPAVNMATSSVPGGFEEQSAEVSAPYQNQLENRYLNCRGNKDMIQKICTWIQINQQSGRCRS